MPTRVLALALSLHLAGCFTAPRPQPHETRFYAADNPTELSKIVNGSAAAGCRMIQVVPWKEAFIAVMDCPRQPAPGPAPCSPAGGRKCGAN